MSDFVKILKKYGNI